MNIKDDLHEMKQARADLQAKLVTAQHWQSCLNCINWQGNLGMEPRCELFKAVPPPHIIVNGCRDHENDIPF